jgi:nucleotide-binding universal stress UspA family protein
VFQNILVAIDGSETAGRALEAATELAEALNSRLTLISVAPEVPSFAYRSGVDVGALEQEARNETEGILRGSADALPDDLPVTTVLKHGNAGEQIVEQLRAGEHDLLVMGSRGRGRVATSLLGSVGAYVHYHARVPMLVIHPEG